MLSFMPVFAPPPSLSRSLQAIPFAATEGSQLPLLGATLIARWYTEGVQLLCGATMPIVSVNPIIIDP
jgi:hypothetical protein